MFNFLCIKFFKEHFNFKSLVLMASILINQHAFSAEFGLGVAINPLVVVRIGSATGEDTYGFMGHPSGFISGQLRVKFENDWKLKAAIGTTFISDVRSSISAHTPDVVKLGVGDGGVDVYMGLVYSRINNYSSFRNSHYENDLNVYKGETADSATNTSVYGGAEIRSARIKDLLQFYGDLGLIKSIDTKKKNRADATRQRLLNIESYGNQFFEKDPDIFAQVGLRMFF
jgi:hypothetical protein